MRSYIRHPTDIPIEVRLHRANEVCPMRNIGGGGLCFELEHPVPKGSTLHIRIPIRNEPFEADGVVVWCKRQNGHYEVGVRFSEEGSGFAVRMVEQVCHIEHYRRQALELEGRYLSREDAAREWIARYAADFPHSSSMVEH